MLSVWWATWHVMRRDIMNESFILRVHVTNNKYRVIYLNENPMLGVLLTSELGPFWRNSMRSRQWSVQAANNMAFSAEKRVFLMERYLILFIGFSFKKSPCIMATQICDIFARDMVTVYQNGLSLNLKQDHLIEVVDTIPYSLNYCSMIIWSRGSQPSLDLGSHSALLITSRATRLNEVNLLKIHDNLLKMLFTFYHKQVHMLEKIIYQTSVRYLTLFVPQ
jgi:hypothetical protein